MDTKHPDSEIIERLGGTAAVARLCQVAQPSVSDWKKTGIPRARLMFLKLAKPEVFGLSKRTGRSTEVSHG